MHNNLSPEQLAAEKAAIIAATRANDTPIQFIEARGRAHITLYTGEAE